MPAACTATAGHDTGGRLTSDNVRAALLALTAVLVTGCSAGAEDQASTPTAPSPRSSSVETGPASRGPSEVASSPAANPSPTVRTIAVRYVGGQVTGTSGREQVKAGAQVVLRVSSDVAEEVHVHGYDLEKPVPAGGTVDIPLTATIPGGFEVELHGSGKVLFQLRVA